MLTVGAQVEKYEVLEHLGGGGFADVYKARHVHLGTSHALKILKPEHVGNEQIRLRFLDEARVQAQLVHPNIARVTDIIVSEGVAGMVMEYLKGRSLADFIEERGGPATEDQILGVMLPVLEALHFAHERGIVHRDVKPDNVFLAVDDNGTQIPRVLDFGIAKVRGELRQEGKRKSTVATGMGTDGYAAPEQLRNAADVDRRADIFSVGVTLYELATGRLPFERPSDADSFVALMKGDYEIPEELRLRSPTIAQSIEGALQTDRNDRFGDCLIFAGVLASRQNDSARPSGVAVGSGNEQRLAATATTGRSEAGLVESKGHAAHDGPGVVETSSQGDGLEPPSLPARKRARPWGLLALALALLVLIIAVGLLRPNLEDRLAGDGLAETTSAPALARSSTKEPTAAAPEPTFTPATPGTTAPAPASEVNPSISTPTPTPEITPPAPAAEITPSISTPTPTPATSPPTPKPKPSTAPPVAARSTVSLTVVTEPTGADLFVDGAAVGTAPWTKEVRPGTVVSVTASSTGHLSTTRIIRVTGGPTQLARVLLAPTRTKNQKPVRVTVTSLPWAYIAVDGRVLGKSSPVTVELSPGPHTIVAENPLEGWSASRTVHVEPGSPITVSFVK